jgi:hypothetical protein
MLNFWKSKKKNVMKINLNSLRTAITIWRRNYNEDPDSFVCDDVDAVTTPEEYGQAVLDYLMDIYSDVEGLK